MALSMFGFYNKKGNFNAEQPIFYCGWDDKYLYVAMDCRENGSNNVVARTSRMEKNFRLRSLGFLKAVIWNPSRIRKTGQQSA